MNYIPAEKLISEIKFAKSVYDNPKRVIHGVADAFRQDGRVAMCDDILKKIASLQQEQPEVQNGKFVFPKYLYARTKDNKTIDMSYAPQDMTAIEYIRNDFVQSGLDEAAEKYSENILANNEDLQDAIEDAFKAGSEWMAGQGYVKEGIARPDDCEIWVNMTNTDIKDGDEVIVQIRKK